MSLTEQQPTPPPTPTIEPNSEDQRAEQFDPAGSSGSPISALIPPDALANIANENARGLTPTNTRFFSESYRYLAQRLEESDALVGTLRKQLDNQKDKCAERDVRISQLVERINGLIESVSMRNMLSLVGTVVIGAAVELYSGNEAPSAILGFVGLTMIVFAFKGVPTKEGPVK